MRAIRWKGEHGILAVRESRAPIGADNEIEVITRKRVIRFYAETEQCMHEWIAAFRQASRFEVPSHPRDGHHPEVMVGSMKRCGEDGRPFTNKEQPVKIIAAHVTQPGLGMPSGWVLLDRPAQHYHDPGMLSSLPPELNGDTLCMLNRQRELTRSHPTVAPTATSSTHI